MRRAYAVLAIAALTVPLLVACGSDEPTAASPTTSVDTDYQTSGEGAQSADTAAPEDTQAGNSKDSEGTTSTDCSDDAKSPKAAKKFGTAPDIAEPAGDPPCELVVEDLTVGKGTPVSDVTTTYSWNYEGVSWSTGEVFDSSFERGTPIPFALQQVISGWTEGLQGMKPGGRRMLVIPSAQAYGEAPPPGSSIAPGETLVFVVDLVGEA